MIQIRTKEINKDTFICNFTMDGCHMTVAGHTFMQAQGKAASIVVDNFELMPVEYATTPSDPVNHPAHYGGNIETIDYIEDKGMMRGFCLGNAIKYISRAGKKDEAKETEDIKKAVFYLNAYIAHLEKNNK